MASYFPMVKNTAQRIVFPILDADGDPVTGAGADTPDSEYSLDGGSFTDCTNEISELATNSGIYYLDLLTGETNGDVVCIQIKTATAGTKTTVLVFYTAAQSLDTMDTNIDDIETDTAVIGALGAGLTNIPWNSSWDAEVQSEVADALTVYDPPTRTEATSDKDAVITEVDANETKIDTLQTQVDTTGVALLAGAVDDIWDELLTGALHNTATSAGRRLRAAGHDISIARDNTCQAGEDASHVKLDSGASASNNFYDHMWIYLESGTGSGQVRLLDDYVGGTKVGEVHPAWLTNPDGSTDFVIMARAETNVHEIDAEGLVQINAEVANALATYDPPTKAEMDTGHGLLATEAKQDIIDANVDDIETDTNEIQISLANGGFTDLLIDAIKAETALIVADTNEVQVSLANGGFTDLLIDAIKAETALIVADTNEIQGKLPTNKFMGSSDGANDDGNINNILTDTDVTIPALIAALNNLSTAQVNTEVDTALADIDLDHFIQVSASAEEPTDGSYLDQVMHKDAGQTFDATTDSLEAHQDGAGTPPTAGQVADAVWDEAKAGHVAGGSMGEEVQSHATPAEVDTECDEALTNYDPPTKTEMDNAHALLATEAKQDIIDTNVDDIETDTGTTIPATVTTLQADVTAVKAKTDNLPSGVTKNAILSNFAFLMVLSADHITPATGLTITAQISKDGGAFAGCANAVAEVANGVYKIDLTAAEMNADMIVLKFTEATTDQRTITLVTS